MIFDNENLIKLWSNHSYACARSKVMSLSICPSVFRHKITRSQGLGIQLRCKHNQTVKNNEKMASVCFKSPYALQIVRFYWPHLHTPDPLRGGERLGTSWMCMRQFFCHKTYPILLPTRGWVYQEARRTKTLEQSWTSIIHKLYRPGFRIETV